MIEDKLIEDLALRRAIIVIGAGVSARSVNERGLHPPIWRIFLESISRGLRSESLIQKLLDQNDYLAACEIVYDEIGKTKFNDKVREAFQSPGFKSCDLHELIFKLDAKVVITPNFDKLYDTYSAITSGSRVIVKNYYDEDLSNLIRTNERLIIKMHGSIDKVTELIFTRRQYSQARIKHNSFYQIIEVLMITNTFLFIGCGLNDPDFKLLFENNFFRYPESREHYMFIPDSETSDPHEAMIKNNLNIKLIKYSIADDYKQLKEYLEMLLHDVEIKRTQIAAYQNW